MNGTPHNNNIIVRFDPLPDLLPGIISPERYLIQEADKEGEANAYGVVTDRRLINPQVVTVVTGNEAWIASVTDTYPAYERDQLLASSPIIPAGKRYFVYYGAYEIAQWLDDGLAIIPAKTLYFEVDPIAPLPGYYLGEEVFTEGELTESGIYLTPYADKKEGILIQITHTSNPELYAVGDTVVTIDEKQYTLTYKGKKYVKLTDRDIIGREVWNDYEPNGDRVMVQYMPDADLVERVTENDRRASLKDFLDKHHMHYQPEDVAPLKEDVFVRAKLLGVGDKCDLSANTLLVTRNVGCILPNGNWILGMDNVIAVIE